MTETPPPLTPATAPREWDAPSYDHLPLPHLRWGSDLLHSLDLRGDETVLDAGAGAGAGTGRDTAGLLARLPHGHVIAVDGSHAMLDRLRQRFASGCTNSSSPPPGRVNANRTGSPTTGPPDPRWNARSGT